MLVVVWDWRRLVGILAQFFSFVITAVTSSRTTQKKTLTRRSLFGLEIFSLPICDVPFGTLPRPLPATLPRLSLQYPFPPAATLFHIYNKWGASSWHTTVKKQQQGNRIYEHGTLKGRPLRLLRNRVQGILVCKFVLSLINFKSSCLIMWKERITSLIKKNMQIKSTVRSSLPRVTLLFLISRFRFSYLAVHY